MNKEQYAYLEKLNTYLNENVGFVIPLENTLNNVTEPISIDRICNLHNSKEDYLAEYSSLYLEMYQKFAYINIKAEYEGLTQEQMVERKIKNNVIFNAVMDNVFEHLIMPAIKKDHPDYSFHENDYAYGGIDRGEFDILSHSLAKTTGTIYVNKFRDDYLHTSSPGYSQIRRAMDNLVNNMRNSANAEDTKKYFREFAAGYAILKNHYERRSLSAYFTINGILEHIYLINVKKTLLAAIKPEHLSGITLPDGGKSLPLASANDKQARELIDLLGQDIDRNEVAYEVDQKVTEFRDYTNEKNNKNEKEEVIVKGGVSGNLEEEDRWITDEELEYEPEVKERDKIIDKTKIYQHIRVEEGRKVPLMKDASKENAAEDKNNEEISLNEKLSEISKEAINDYVIRSIENDKTVAEQNREFKKNYEEVKKEAAEMGNPLSKEDKQFYQDMSPAAMDKKSGSRHNVEIDFDEVDMDKEVIEGNKSENEISDESFLDEDDKDLTA